MGAGIIGVSVAFNLAKTLPPPVVVVDKGRAGSGSTASALGGFRHQFSSRLNVELSIESVAILEDLKQTMGVDPLLRYDGYAFIAEAPESFDALKRNVLTQRSLGVPVEVYTGAELQSLLPFYNFKDVLGGTLCYRDGHALTSAVHQAYLSGALQSGAELLENTEVTGINLYREWVTGVETTRGRIDCEKVVIAAGPYYAQVGKLVGLNIPVIPTLRKILFTKGTPPNVPESFPLIVNVDSTLAIGKEPRSIFFSDNMLNIQGFEADFPPEYDEELFSKAIERMPLLSDLPIGYFVKGLYEITPDSNPIVSECGIEGLYICAGFSGHGFMHAPAIDVIMAELVG
ncbi:MAG: FAD-dependent oxidoreductase [Thermoprotei archaeon]